MWRPNVSIGEGLKLFAKLEIRGEGRVVLGANCVIARVPGDRRHYVTIYTHSPLAEVSIGKDAVLYSARISSRFSISIGDRVAIEESQIADTDFHSMSLDRGDPKENAVECRVNIGDEVLVGARCVICKGVTIGNNVSILPGSIVNKSVPTGAAVCGNPAKAIVMRSASATATER